MELITLSSNLVEYTSLAPLERERYEGEIQPYRKTDYKLMMMICKYAGDVGAMTKAIWAALLHSINTDNNPQHGNCHRDQDSWCIFNMAVALLAPIPKHSISTISTWLHPKIGEIITPLYERMADENLLIRMSSGGTQNSNESLNNLLWVYAPKVCVGHKHIVSQLQSAIMRLNAG